MNNRVFLSNQPMGRGKLSALSILFLFFLFMGGSAHAEYRLGPQDKISLKAHQWRETHADVFKWPALNGEFSISASGHLPLPLIGEILAKGLTPSELAAAIELKLKTGLGLGVPPNISIEVVRYRPFYIVGVVDRPGEYAYRPGLTVLQALSLAGGLRRVRDESFAALSREVISRRGQVKELDLTINGLLARRARLIAEIKGRKNIEFPVQLLQQDASQSVSLLLEQEKLIFGARRESLVTQIKSIEKLIEFLRDEVKHLGGQMAVQKKQIDLLDKQLVAINILIEKKLTPQSRLFALQRTQAEMVSAKLRLDTSLVRAKQDISRAAISIINLRNKRRNEVADLLSKTQSELEKTIGKSATMRQLLHDAEVTAPMGFARRTRSEDRKPIYKIVRLGGKVKYAELKATEATVVKPGDTIKVEMPDATGEEEQAVFRKRTPSRPLFSRKSLPRQYKLP